MAGNALGEMPLISTSPEPAVNTRGASWLVNGPPNGCDRKEQFVELLCQVLAIFTVSIYKDSSVQRKHCGRLPRVTGNLADDI